MTDVTPDLDGLEALDRLDQYLTRRGRAFGLDRNEIHAFDVGPDDEGVYLTAADIRVAVALARRAVPGGGEEIGVVTKVGLEKLKEGGSATIWPVGFEGQPVRLAAIRSNAGE